MYTQCIKKQNLKLIIFKHASLLWWLILLHRTALQLLIYKRTFATWLRCWWHWEIATTTASTHSFLCLMGISNYRCPVCNKEPWRLENEHSCYSITLFKEVIWSILKKYVLVIQCLVLSWLHAVFPEALNCECPVCNKEPWRLENEHSCYSITLFKEVIWSILKKYVLVIQCLMLSRLHAVFPGVLNWSILSAAWFIFAVTAVIYTTPHQYSELMSKIYQFAERHNLPKNVRCIIF